LRLQKSLRCAGWWPTARILVDQSEPEYSTKMERLQELLEGLLVDPTRKIVIFSEWKRMLTGSSSVWKGPTPTYVRLDGSVPQRTRPSLVRRFQEDPECRAILMTNAGSTGLNLQAANTVINVDLPWNPAMLEQRIARAHRMGQEQPVMVYKLVTEETLEERLLETLAPSRISPGPPWMSTRK
jgi:SNF2 family DNA or RNA helicase